MGLDLVESSAFEHLDPRAVERAARRWLSAEERAWCALQPSWREAVVTVLSCKESAFKASDGSVGLEALQVTMGGRWPGGWARATGVGTLPVTLWWEAGSGHILTVGVAGPVGTARAVLQRLIAERAGVGPN